MPASLTFIITDESISTAGGLRLELSHIFIRTDVTISINLQGQHRSDLVSAKLMISSLLMTIADRA